MHQMALAVQADGGIATRIARALPHVAARQRIDLGAGREALLDGPAWVGLLHWRIISEEGPHHLFWSLEVQRVRYADIELGFTDTRRGRLNSNGQKLHD